MKRPIYGRKLPKNPNKLLNVRLVIERNGHLDGGEYHKPQWAVLFERDGINCRMPVKCGGERTPLGQDVIDAMRPYIKQGRITETDCLDMNIIDVLEKSQAR